MASLVLGHLMNGVMDSIEVQCFGTLGDAQFVLTCTGFCQHTLLHIGLGVPNDITQQLGKLGAMLGLFKGILTECCGNLRITLAVSLTGHRQIHAYFSSLAHEMSVQVFLHLLVAVLGHANDMLARELDASGLVHYFPFNDLFALWATFGSFFAFENKPANRADKFLAFHTFDCLVVIMVFVNCVYILSGTSIPRSIIA